MEEQLWQKKNEVYTVDCLLSCHVFPIKKNGLRFNDILTMMLTVKIIEMKKIECQFWRIRLPIYIRDEIFTTTVDVRAPSGTQCAPDISRSFPPQ